MKTQIEVDTFDLACSLNAISRISANLECYQDILLTIETISDNIENDEWVVTRLEEELGLTRRHIDSAQDLLGKLRALLRRYYDTAVKSVEDQQDSDSHSHD